MNTSSTYPKKIKTIEIMVICGAVLYLFFRSFFSSGQLTPDGINYLLQAQNFWDYKVNFPLGYPFLIKIFSFFTGSFFIASKLVNILAYLGIILFSYRKRFFFPQTLILFSFYPFLDFFTFTLSEPVFYFLNYLLIYYVFEMTKEGFKIKFALYFGVLFFFLVSMRFSGIFLFISTLLYFSYLFFKKEISLKNLFILSLIAVFGVLFYLMINYFYSGFFLGERNNLALKPTNIFNFLTEIFASTARDFSFLNVFLHKGILSKFSFLNFWIGFMMIVSGLLLFFKKKNRTDHFSIYLFFSFLIILCGVFYSYYTTSIDDTIRIKSNAYLFLAFFLLLNLPKIIIKFLKIIVIIILFINIGTLITYSESINEQYLKLESLLCQSSDKTVAIIYKNDIAQERKDAEILLFKAICIDRNYKIEEHLENGPSKKSDCSVESSKLKE